MPADVLHRTLKLRSGERATAWMMFAYSFLAMTSYNLVKPLTKAMEEGKAPMRSFSDLKQLMEKKKEKDAPPPAPPPSSPPENDSPPPPAEPT